MRLCFALALLIAITSPALAEDPPKSFEQLLYGQDKRQTVRLAPHNFTLPAGFTIERVAGPPQVDRPIVADFDDDGQLFVADSSGTNDRPNIQLEKPSHRIVRLTDTNDDGVFDKSTVFADKMMFPEGLLCYRGSVYVATPPQIWKLTDTDGDGAADKREIWFDGKTLTGCANDLHGPYLGRDGRIYWCKGAFAEQTYTLPNGKKFTTKASHIFRAKPDGSEVEPVMTGGMDNPVDCVFTNTGERIFTTTFLQNPGGGNRDGLIHAVYGGIYGKEHDVIHTADHRWTSPHLMPVLSHMGPAAPCGLLHCESAFKVTTSWTTLFACQFNLRKVSRHDLGFGSGSTYQSRDSDFLVSDNTDFHPTDVIEDARGHLLVIDTGGWYKMCCPSSQLAKADVLGAIYRIRPTRKDNSREDPWGRELGWKLVSDEDLVKRLDDMRGAVRRRAVREIGTRGASIVPALRTKTETFIIDFEGKQTKAWRPDVAIDALWAACRIDAPLARALIRDNLRSSIPDTSVRRVAAHCAGLWRDREAVAGLVENLKSDDLHLRRACAEALGRIGDKSVIAALLDAAADPKVDRVLHHSLTYAMIEIGDADSLRIHLQDERPRVRQAALTAFDQLGGALKPADILPLLDHADPQLRETARWIAGRHPDWAGDLVEYMKSRLQAAGKETDRAALADLLAAFVRDSRVQQVLADAVREAKDRPESAKLALTVMKGAPLKEAPESWVSVWTAQTAPSSPVLLEVLATARGLPAPKSAAEFAATLDKLSEATPAPETRLRVFAAWPGGMTNVSAERLEFLLFTIDLEQTPAIRGLAVDVLSRAKLTNDQLKLVAGKLPRISPLELDRVLGIFTQSTDEEVGRSLLKALGDKELRGVVTVDAVRQRIAKYPESVLKEAEDLYHWLDTDFAEQKAHLEEVAKSLPTGDIRRGQAVFNSSRTSCIACHNIGYVGGKTGPDLTRIGAIRTERDLLESILFPSASLVRSYEPVQVVTTDGRTFSGLVKRDNADGVVLTIAADKEATIARGDIELMQPSKVSVMPAGLEKQLSRQEIADLVAFLRNCK